VKRPVLHEIFPYGGEVVGHRLSLWLIVGCSCCAVLAQAVMTFYGYFADGKETLRWSTSEQRYHCRKIERVTKVFMLLARQKNPGPTLFSCPRGTTASVRERLGICWRIKLQNSIHVGDIQSPGSHISSQKQRRCFGSRAGVCERIQRSRPGRRGKVTVK